MKCDKEKKKEYNKEYYLKNKEYRKEYNKEYYLKTQEQKKEYSKEYYSQNKEKRLKQFKEQYLKNKEQRNKQMREHYLQKKEQYQERQKKYNSKPETKELIRNRVNKRYKTDINFRIGKLCRGRILHALKRFNKSASTMELLGCTVDELRQHLESQFEPWMTWKNHGLWDIDHIIACAKFNLVDPEQQRICFNWSNLQPLEHIENIKKGAR